MPLLLHAPERISYLREWCVIIAPPDFARSAAPCSAHSQQFLLTFLNDSFLRYKETVFLDILLLPVRRPGWGLVEGLGPSLTDLGFRV